MKDLHSDDNEEESDEAEDNDNDSEMERPVNRGGSRSRRVSLSDGSDSESSSASSPLHHEPPPPLLKTNNNQILEVKSPIKQSKSDKQIKNGECDKAYLDELVELHRRLMTLRERHILQQVREMHCSTTVSRSCKAYFILGSCPRPWRSRQPCAVSTGDATCRSILGGGRSARC